MSHTQENISRTDINRNNTQELRQTDYPAQKRIPVSVLLLPKFENGEMADDFPGEAQYFYENYCRGGDAYSIFGGYEGNKLYVRDSVALYVTGCGKVNAVLSLLAVLQDSRFDFSDAVVISIGCAGSSVENTVMGDVFVITAAIDYDLGHHADARELTTDRQTTWFRNSIYDNSAFRCLNTERTEKVWQLVKDTVLQTTEKTRTYMASSFKNVPLALREPQVLLGTTVSGDNYWKGSYDHRNALAMVASYRAPHPFVCAEMEDAALAVALDRIGMLDRFIILRASVNMDVFADGITPEMLWGTNKGAAFDSDGGLESGDIFATAMENLFKVGSKVIDAILAGTQ